VTESAAWRVASRTVILFLSLIFLGWLIVQLRSVVVQVMLAIILSAGMTPLVDRITLDESVRHWRWKPPRALIVLALYLTLVLLVLLFGAIVIPPLAIEIEDLVTRVPGYLVNFELWLENMSRTNPFFATVDAGDQLGQLSSQLASQITIVLSQALVVVRVAMSLLGGILDTIFTLILALYITADSKRIVSYLQAFAPVDRRVQAARISERIGQRLGGWLRGQLLLSAIIGTMTLIGLSLIGVHYAVLLAFLAAIGEVIPMVGPIFSAIPAVIIAFTQSPVHGLLTLGLYVLVQQLENNLVVPKVMSRAVELHPLVVMLALLAGSQLMGITGAILSVPVAAALAVIVDEVRREWVANERLDEPEEMVAARPRG
jgi:predicted PurR-regulated permease PerM